MNRTPPDGGDPFSNAEFLEVYREGFRRSPEAVAVIALDDRVVDVNAAGEQLVGYTRAESVGKTTDELGWWVERAERAACLDDLRRTGTTVRRIHLRHRHDGIRDVYVAGSLIEVAGQSFGFWIARDVTGERLSEAEAGRLRNDLARLMTERSRLITQLIHAADQERGRLSDRLRAGPIQQLTASQASVEVLRASVDPTQVRALERVQRSIAAAIDELRRISTELGPSVLQREGLGSAVRALLAGQEDHGLAFDLADHMSGDVPSEETSAIAYRVVFETLLCVRESSLGGRAHVTLASDETDLTVTIAAPERTTEADPSTANGATGLGTLSALLDAVGGALEVSTRASGTVVTAIIPRVLV